VEIDGAGHAATNRMSDALALYCAPALIVPSLDSSPTDIIAGGTFSLVSTPSRQLFITAYHVWARLKRAKEDYPNAVIAAYLGPLHGVIALTELAFLDGDENTVDLAILASRTGRISLNGKQFFQVPEWPIPKVKENESVDLLGYTGEGREVAPFSLDLGYSHFTFGVSSVSDRQFVLAPSFGPRIFTIKDPKQADRVPIGGMSGGPVFFRHDSILHLVGFVRAGGFTDEPIFASHAAFLQQDGTLDHLAIPH
jgi:hypothetical protein